MSKKSNNGSFVDDIERTLLDKRELHIVGALDDGQAYTFVKMLRYAALQSSKPIRVYLNTPGGPVTCGLHIYDHVLSVARRVPIEIIASGACMSMGVILLQAGTSRLSLPNTRFLLHEVQSRSGGSLSNMRDDMSEMERLQVKLDEILGKRTGQDMKKLRKKFERRDYFLDAPEALEYNLIDAIVDK